MQLTIRLDNSDDAISKLFLNLPGKDPLISEIIGELRQQLSPWYIAIMERGIEGLEGPDGVDSVVGGLESLPKKASLFLAIQGDDGLTKLESTKRISDYQIKENSTLWLMCSAWNLGGE